MPIRDFKKLSNDSMFKLVFVNKKYMNWLLERFLNKKIDDYKIINKIDNKEVSEENILELLMQELNQGNVHVKKKTVDLLIKKDDDIIDIEVNNIFDKNVRKRNYAYLSSIYSNSLKHGQNYDNQPRCTQINICNNIKEDYAYDKYCLLGENYNNKFVDNINFLFIRKVR